MPMYEVHGLYGKTCTLQTCFEFLSTSITITAPELQVHRIFTQKASIKYALFPLLATSPLYLTA